VAPDEPVAQLIDGPLVTFDQPIERFAVAGTSRPRQLVIVPDDGDLPVWIHAYGPDALRPRQHRCLSTLDQPDRQSFSLVDFRFLFA
jgi:hypothetical protein